jgi:hypothetical protein
MNETGMQGPIFSGFEQPGQQRKPKLESFFG